MPRPRDVSRPIKVVSGKDRQMSPLSLEPLVDLLHMPGIIVPEVLGTRMAFSLLIGCVKITTSREN